MPRRLIGLAALGLFVLLVYIANLALSHWPNPVPVGFGLEAPVAVYFVGVSFTVRDVVHHELGRWYVFAGILAGAALSYWLEANAQLGGPVSLALASGLAFLVSETADLAVYAPLRRRGWLPAVLASNVVGLVVDSALFLWLAFGSLAFFWGQVVGKSWMTLAAIGALALWRWRLREPMPA
jgi:uncharacterized PurR-regulated membrane protein YhhQ (DUF165 family)